LFKGLLTGVREVALAGEEGGGIGGKLPPNMLKSPDFKTNIGTFLTDWISSALLSKHSINLLTPQPHFLIIKDSLPV